MDELDDAVFGNACGTALAFADEIHRRVNINQEPARRVARRLGMEHTRILSVARIAKTFGGVPSKRRLAVIAMKTPDVDNEDIAEWFGESVAWAADVRARAGDIRLHEYIPAHEEWIIGEYEPDLPSPEEIEAAKAELHAKGLACMLPCGSEVGRTPGIRQLFWHGGQRAFISVGA